MYTLHILYEHQWNLELPSFPKLVHTGLQRLLNGYGWGMTLSICCVFFWPMFASSDQICSLKLDKLGRSKMVWHIRRAKNSWLPPGGMKPAWAMPHGACGWMIFTWKLRCDLPKPPRSRWCSQRLWKDDVGSWCFSCSVAYVINCYIMSVT